MAAKSPKADSVNELVNGDGSDVNPEEPLPVPAQKRVHDITAALWSTALISKKFKTLFTLLKAMEAEQPHYLTVSLEKYLSKWPEEDIKLQQVAFASQLIEESRIAQSVMRSRLPAICTCLKNGMNLLVVKIRQITSPPTKFASPQGHLLLIMKLTFQIIKYCHQEFASLDKELVMQMRASMLDVLQLASLFKEYRMLTGLALAHSVNLNENVLDSFLEMYNSLSESDRINFEENSKISFRNINLTDWLFCASEHDVAKLSLLRGFLAYCKPHQVFHAVVNGDEETLNFGIWVFLEIFSMCTTSSTHLTFNVLEMWFAKMDKFIGSIISNKELDTSVHQEKVLFAKDGLIWNAALQLIWTNMDNPVDGINEICMRIFKHLLSVCTHFIEHDKLTVGERGTPGKSRNMLEELLRTFCELSWKVKGKHALIACMLEYIHIDNLFKQDPDVISELLNCLATNYLASCATNLFVTILKQLQVLKRAEELVDWVVDGLCHKNDLLKYNVSHMWLPHIVRISKEMYKSLVEYFQTGLARCTSCNGILTESGQSNRNELLYALVTTLKCARANHMNIPLPQALRESLLSINNELRVDAFSLLGNSPKKSEPFMEVEIKLLQESLSYSMNSDSAPFRHEMQTLIRSVICRGRDSAIACLKQDTKCEMPVVFMKTMRFLDWVWTLCIENLHPGSNYQRLNTSLEWTKIFFECFTYKENTDQKKGKTPQAVETLLSKANDLGLLIMHTEEVSSSILSCLLHSTDEIRDVACEIFYVYLPLPLPGCEDSDGSHLKSCSTMLASGLRLCNSPKAAESQGGAHIVTLVFCKLVSLQSVLFDITKEGDGNYKVLAYETKDNAVLPAEFDFIESLVNELEFCVKMAKTDIVEAATLHPAHGMFLVIGHCLLGCRTLNVYPVPWGNLISRLVGLSTELLSIVLATLGGTSESDGSIPSFEDIELSVQTAVANCNVGQSTCETSMETKESSKHQMVMSYCWLNIRRISHLQGLLVENVCLFDPYINVETIKKKWLKHLLVY